MLQNTNSKTRKRPNSLKDHDRSPENLNLKVLGSRGYTAESCTTHIILVTKYKQQNRRKR